MIKIVDQFWEPICWDCQHLLGFSAHEYFQWDKIEVDGFVRWQRKRPMRELLWFFERLMNIRGTAVNEAVLLHPETIEFMASQKDDGRPGAPRIFGHTQLVDLLMALIEVQTGKPLKRPVIPGLELRTNRKIIRTKSAVERAQERSRQRKAKSKNRSKAMRSANKGA